MAKRYFLLVLTSILIAVTAQAQTVYDLNANSLQTAEYLKPSSSYLPFESMKDAKIWRLFALNPALQHAESVNVGDIVNLQLFENDIYTATISNIVTDVNGTLALTLKLPDYPMSFAIITTSTEGKSLVTVSIPELDRNFGSRYNANANYLIEIDDNKVEYPHNEDDAIPIPKGIEITENGSRLRSFQADCGPAAKSNEASVATISLLIAYTPVAASSQYTAARSGINNVISSMIALGNLCMSNSQTGITLYLAHSVQVSYVGTDLSPALNALQNTSDGSMDNVHALRKQYNADLVQLLCAGNTGGLGYTLSDTKGRYEYGFSAAGIESCGDSYPCSVHEIGHNMGLGHGAQHITNWANGIFDYSYGWTWAGTTAVSGTTKKGSVMTYWGGENYSDGVKCYNVAYFSNPSVNFEGKPTGTTTAFTPNGKNKTADAARSLREMKHVIAYYSNRVANLPDIPTNIVVSNPTDNGATFSWDACANATSYRVCYSIGGGYYSYYTIYNTTFTINYAEWFPSPCTSYDFFIQSVNECGDVVNSPTILFKTKCATDPTVTTSAATNVTNRAATLNKTVTVNGTAVSGQGFKYKKTTESAWQTSLDGNLTGLTAATQYQFYAYATTTSATFTGSTFTFTTAAAPDLTSWSPQNNSTIWPDELNWTNGVPGTTSKVIIPKSASYPVLTANTTVDEIYFRAGAELGRQDLLSYQKAFVQYDFSNPESRGRWHMLSLPLQQAYPGDFTFGGYPSTWVRKFTAKADEGSGIVKAGWETARASTEAFKIGDGFIIWLEEDGVENKGLKSVNGILELPFFANTSVPASVHYTHDFNGATEKSTFYNFRKTDEGGYERIAESYQVDRTPLAYRLAGSSVNENLNFGADGNSEFALVGNPFIANLDFSKLQAANQGKITSTYQVWTGKGEGAGYVGYDLITGSPIGIETSEDLTGIIASSQSFIVEKANGSSSGNLTFNISMTEVGQTQLRSGATQSDKLNIVARNEVAAVRTFIAQREGGQTEFGGNDSRKLMNGISRVPEIYSLKPFRSNVVALGSNFINTDNLLIPVGLATAYSGNITLTFTGMDTYQANINLLDVVENKEIDLTGLGSYEYTFHYTPVKQNGQAIANEDRFFIRFSPTNLTGLPELASVPVTVYGREGFIHVISNNANPINRVLVYNTQGALAYESDALKTTAYTTRKALSPGVYVVKVVSEKGVQNVKVIINLVR